MKEIKRLFLFAVLIVLLCRVGHSASMEEAIVYPRVVAARDGSGAQEVTFSAMGMNFALNLKPSPPVLSKGFLHIHADETGQVIKEWVDTKEIQARLFQDPDTGAAVHLNNDGPHPIMVGLLSDEYRILPANSHPRSALEPIPHKVYKANLPLGEIGEFDIVEPPVNITEELDVSLAETENRRNSPMIVETFLTIDHTRLKALEKEGVDPTYYAAIFMNGVQVRYSQLSNPSITIKLAGLILNKNIDSQPYIEDYRVGDKLQGFKAIDDYRDYMNDWQSDDPDVKFDYAYLLTGLDLYWGLDPIGQTSTSGISQEIAGVCGSQKYGIGEDIEDLYDGVYIAIHEIAHSLGCHHDGQGRYGKLGPGYPGSQRCPKSDGYLMGSGIKRNHRFSPCCIACMRWFAGQSRSDCTRQHDYEKERNPWARYPGHEINETAYCNSLFKYLYDSVIAVQFHDQSKPENKCRLQCCHTPSNDCYIRYKLDGHPCKLNGSQGHCENRQCVKRP